MIQKYAFKKTWVALTVVVILIAVVVLVMAPVKKTREFDALPDFSAMSDVKTMKVAFFRYLKPIAQYHNHLIAGERAQLIALKTRWLNKGALTKKDKRLITALAKKYDYPANNGEITLPNEAPLDALLNSEKTQPIKAMLDALLLRVDEVPVSLALVQAAKESGWGRSRFAVTANNLFGQWCYAEGCGVVPKHRKAGATHEVMRFASVSEAMASYMHNLNTHPSYAKLRKIRANLHAKASPITGEALAEGLIFYSQRRGAYVKDILVMLRDYRTINLTTTHLKTINLKTTH